MTPIPAESHKGIRRRIAVVGGSRGMAGATILAARGAFRTGVGMVRLIVDDASLAAVQVGAVEATAAPWPNDDTEARALVDGYAHALLIGNGIGRTAPAKALVERMLRAWTGPTVLDADVFSHFAGNTAGLRALLSGRPAVLTPHASEFARLLGLTTDDVMARRFTLPVELAREIGAVVLLKGVPTVIASPGGETLVSASGTPALAAAGSGDVLGGMIATLLAQGGDPLQAAACGAWAHGRAAEIANAGRPVRGVTLDDVLDALPFVWRFDAPPPQPPALTLLPAVGDRPRTRAVADA
jgi:NAD(P)H-hydrate epimerase